MPLKLVTARSKKTKSIYVRGSYLGIKVDASCRTDRPAVARKVKRRIEAAIERGEYRKQAAPGRPRLTFLDAALAYLETGHRSRYVAALIDHFGETPLDEIDQAAIDDAAAALKPNVTNCTRNTCVYTPIAAILHRAGIEITIRRPPGAKGRTLTDFLEPPDAFGIIAAAQTFDREFAVLLKFLLYTGPRIGGALNLTREDVRLADRRAWARPQKGQPANEIQLADDLCAALEAHLASHDNRRVFRFHQGGHLKFLLTRAKLLHLGLPCPRRRAVGWRAPKTRLDFVTFHTFRHTWATWMRRYGGVDVKGLVATKNWRDERSAARYAHAVAREEWGKVDSLPQAGKTRGSDAA